MGFSRQVYRSGLPFPSPEIFPTQGLNMGLLHYTQTHNHLSHQGSPKETKDTTELKWVGSQIFWVNNLPHHSKTVFGLCTFNYMCMVKKRLRERNSKSNIVGDFTCYFTQCTYAPERACNGRCEICCSHSFLMIWEFSPSLKEMYSMFLYRTVCPIAHKLKRFYRIFTLNQCISWMDWFYWISNFHDH